ncbi:MAG: FAD-dependent thymidylate synthase [candidate division Zixibacteria bacterium]|jgi:thymidylate synthase (FAD)|nr:FAD-dependent thymidylate synthase [candidate division Zixibacteria bacterium]
MAHVSVPEADAILDKQFDVLDHGFVRLIDYMGSDESIVQAARVSYGKGTKKVSEDRGLIRYLMRHHHTTPFEMVELKFHVKLPIFVARQWIRHRTANVNEYSGRYSVMKEEFYLPPPDALQYQSTVNKQGREEEKELPDAVKDAFREHAESTQKALYERYVQFVDEGLARELARINLPLSLYTEWYWKIDLHNLFHFLRLRLDPHAQKEIRAYAAVMAEITRAVCPMAYEAFEDYALNALYFSGPELRVIGHLLEKFSDTAETLVEKGLSKREAREFLSKLAAIRKLES